MREYYKRIDANGQMFDFKGFYEFIANTHLKDDCRIVEIGLANGKSSIFLAETLMNSGIHVDRFVGVDNCAYGGEDQRNEIIRHIISAKVDIEFIEMSSLDASCKFPDNYFDFIFIDSSHLYDQTRSEILLWYKKLKINGVLAGHDYLAHAEVRRVVDEIVPVTFTRPPLNDTIFEPTIILNIEETENGYGVWYFQKHFFMNLNY